MSVEALAASLFLILVALGSGWLIGTRAERQRWRDELTAIVKPDKGEEIIDALQARLGDLEEKVRQARHREREFLADAAHELKTPLTGLIGYTRGLARGDFPPGEVREKAISNVCESAERLYQLAQNLLDFAHATSRFTAVKLERQNLHTAVEEAIGHHRLGAQERGIELQLVGSELFVRSDAQHLRQVVGNLVSNAVKHAPAGSVARFEIQGEPGHAVLRASNPVADPAPDPARLFDRLYRGDPARSPGGAGLGLAIAHKLAELQGGSLSAELKQGQIIFTLRLPAAP